MGSFTSLLCCGADGSNDTEDKYHKQPPQKVTSSQKGSSKNGSTTKTQPKANASGPIKSSKHHDHAVQNSPTLINGKTAVDEDHSVNESDTITTGNEEPSNLDKKKSEIETGQGVAVMTSERETENIVEHAKPDEQESLSDAELRDETESTLDLTAIQEGQASDPETGFLLGKKDVKRFGNKKCLILDLDETLVHSSFKYLRTADFVIPVKIDEQIHHVYVIKRPGVDEFLRQVGQWYEVVVFTASVSKYGDPLLNKLDIHHAVHQRLYRDSCYTYQGNFIKNLSQIGRPLEETIIIDNSPASYIFHPQHSIPISSWFSDSHDNELLDLLPLLEDMSKPNVDDVSLVLDISI